VIDGDRIFVPVGSPTLPDFLSNATSVPFDALALTREPLEVLLAQPHAVTELIGEHVQLGAEKVGLLVKNPVQAMH